MDAARLNSWMNHVEAEEDAYHYAMHLATACALPMNLKTAVELNLLEIISHTGTQACWKPILKTGNVGITGGVSVFISFYYFSVAKI